ncbi:hypothetical protein LTR86_005858 [Recurvomyces mirabilis]|nr:hypothetical protein LTR86_005858 [Recurvomyces mirabilis]
MSQIKALSDHALIGLAAKLPKPASSTVLSMSPITLQVSQRAVPLQLRISVPADASAALPIILLSHGHGRSNNLSSLHGYGALVDHWSAHGFAVIQPTHLSSKTLSLTDHPDAPLFWRSRVEDMSTIIDHLNEIEDTTPFLSRGSLDRDRIAVAGHSLGGHTACLLLGTQSIDPKDDSVVNLHDARIKAGLILAAPGSGGKDLSATAYENYTILRHPDFSTMKTPALVVVGDEDVGPHLTLRGADWHADPYTCAPGPKSLLTLKGGKHGIGGVSGYDAKECDDESPERVAVLQRMTAAYLRSELYDEYISWSEASKALEGVSELGFVQHK